MTMMAGSISVRFDRVISAQALLVTSATREMAATTPKNMKLGRAPGADDGVRTALISPRDGGGENEALAGSATNGAAGSRSATGAGWRGSRAGGGSVGSLLLILRVEFLRQLAPCGYLVQYLERGREAG